MLALDPLTPTVAEALADPPAPVHVIVKIVATVMGPVDAVPLVDLFPVQPPVAAHVAAFVLVQLSVEAAPLATVVGFATKMTEGDGLAVTVTVTDPVPVPLLPEQLRPKVLLDESGPVLCEPDVALVPLQAPDAVQVAAPVLFQVRVDALPDVTLLGVAENVTDGGALPPPSGRTSIALTKASPASRVKTRLSVASVVTMKVRSATVLTGTEWLASTTCPSASTRKLRVPHDVQDSRNRSVTSTCPGVTGIA